MHPILILIASLFLYFSNASIAIAENVHVAAIDWCPQLCSDENKPGYVNEITELIFVGSQYKLLIETFSWSRAIHQVKVGESFALLSPAKAEAPGLIYPSNEIGVQRMCIFIPANNKWRYSGAESLKKLRIGIASDASIEALNPYVNDKSFNFQPMHYDKNFIAKNIKMIAANRLDAFIFTQNTTRHQLNKMGINQNYINAGCVSEEKIYMAFSSDQSLAGKVNALKKYFDEKIIDLYRSGKIDEVLNKYQVTPWRK